MRSRSPRTFALVAALLVLPLLALTVGTFASHEGHGCRFEKDCLACRWAAASTAVAAASIALPEPVEVPAPVAPAPIARFADGAARTHSSRGPPLS